MSGQTIIILKLDKNLEDTSHIIDWNASNVEGLIDTFWNQMDKEKKILSNLSKQMTRDEVTGASTLILDTGRIDDKFLIYDMRPGRYVETNFYTVVSLENGTYNGHLHIWVSPQNDDICIADSARITLDGNINFKSTMKYLLEGARLFALFKGCSSIVVPERGLQLEQLLSEHGFVHHTNGKIDINIDSRRSIVELTEPIIGGYIEKGGILSSAYSHGVLGQIFMIFSYQLTDLKKEITDEILKYCIVQ